MSSQFVWPMVAMLGLTAAVWTLAIHRRIGEIRRRRIPLPSLAKARDVAATFQDCEAMDNFNNLMQMPVLFYVLCLLLQQHEASSVVFVIGAWAYVVLRVLHSLIQLTSNRVKFRFYAWAVSSVLLFGLWAGFAIHVYL